jgi:hypothetical protein
MGGVFLRRSVPAKVGIIHDLSRDAATFFRVLQRFLAMVKRQRATRTDFDPRVETSRAFLLDTCAVSAMAQLPLSGDNDAKYPQKLCNYKLI